MTGASAAAGANADEAKRAKAALRQQTLAARRALGAEARARASAVICDKIAALPEFQRATCVAAFASMPEEVDLWALLRRAAAAGKKVALPRVLCAKSRRMEFCLMPTAACALVAGYGGILQPPPNAPVVKTECFDFALVPALAVDRQQKRLGYGGGFYDIFLHSRPQLLSCSPVFRCQLVDSVFAEPHDQAVGIVVCESSLPQ